MENDNTSLWNKKTTDLTVGDTVKMTLVTPILMMGSMIAAGAIVGVAGTVAKKFRKPAVVETPTTPEQ